MIKYLGDHRWLISKWIVHLVFLIPISLIFLAIVLLIKTNPLLGVN